MLSPKLPVKFSDDTRVVIISARFAGSSLTGMLVGHDLSAQVIERLRRTRKAKVERGGPGFPLPDQY
jgi:hypothetical protein